MRRILMVAAMLGLVLAASGRAQAQMVTAMLTDVADNQTGTPSFFVDMASTATVEVVPSVNSESAGVAFNISALPNGATITSATLTLYDVSTFPIDAPINVTSAGESSGTITAPEFGTGSNLTMFTAASGANFVNVTSSFTGLGPSFFDIFFESDPGQGSTFQESIFDGLLSPSPPTLTINFTGGVSTVTPEPSTLPLALGASAVSGLAYWWRRRRRGHAA